MEFLITPFESFSPYLLVFALLIIAIYCFRATSKVRATNNVIRNIVILTLFGISYVAPWFIAISSLIVIIMHLASSGKGGRNPRTNG